MREDVVERLTCATVCMNSHTVKKDISPGRRRWAASGPAAASAETAAPGSPASGGMAGASCYCCRITRWLLIQ
jgi:hypothetical protein